MSTKYGQWIYAHDLAGMRYYRCTNCAAGGVETLGAENEVTWWNYCPRCGAKMQIKNTEQEKVYECKLSENILYQKLILYSNTVGVGRVSYKSTKGALQFRFLVGSVTLQPKSDLVC